MGDTLWTRGLAALRGFLGGGTAKSSIADGDKLLVSDSEASNALKTVLYSVLKSQVVSDIAPITYEGSIDCSGSPNYPAADAGHAYIVSVAGKIGGASGVVVAAGDMAICKVDSSASGDQATVGANWNIIEKNIDLGNITITGGTIDGTTIGGTTPANGDFLLLTGNFNEIVQASSDTLTVAELRGQLISNYGQGAADNLQGLPTAAEGMSFMLVCGTAQAANYFGVQADTNDKIYLDGTAGSDNGIVKINAPVVGAKIYFHTFQTGDSAWDWAADTISGLWVAA